MQPEEASTRNDWPALHGVLVAALMTGTGLLPALCIWPLLLLAPLAADALVVATIPPLRHSFRCWAFGHISRAAILAAILLGGGAVGVLLAFDYFARPDVSGYAQFLPVGVLGGVMIAGVIFSVLNAVMEEVIFRGILFDAVESQWGARVAVASTALLFGYAHLQGYPPGPFGVVLAGGFALGLGSLRVFTRGLGLPILVHIAADATIYLLLVQRGVLKASL
jgi:membrane protease YdiL (CAAX protease family)